MEDDSINIKDVAKGVGVLVVIAVVFCFLVDSCQGIFGGFEKGDIVKMNTEMFATRTPAIDEQLGAASLHEDRVGVLQLIADGKVRMVPSGTKGRVIATRGDLIEVRFNDDPLFNWWVRKEFLTKVN